MSSAIERKLQREIASRKQAEQLLEAKSRELYTTNQQLQFALHELEKSSVHNIQQLEFQQQIDTLLIQFGRRFLHQNLDDVVLTSFVQRLCESGIIGSALLSINQHCSLNIANHQFGDSALTVTAGKQRQWQDNQLSIPLNVSSEMIGSLVVSVTQDIGFKESIENSLCLVAELLCSALSRQIILESNIKSRQQAEASERATREFLAMINHELRTPLNGLLGNSELLFETELSSLQKSFVKNIVHSGEFLRVIINDLLDFSKLNAGMFELNNKAFSWDELASTLNSIFDTKAVEKSLQFTIRTSHAVPKHFFGDQERVSQILVNLIGNAIKFTERGSVTLDVDWNESGFVFDIQDTGIGISKSAQATLFQPFTQADRSSKREYEGTGLGLAICQQLISLMGGSIELESELGKGCRFTVRLPIKTVEPPSRASTTTLDCSDSLAGLNILVVEDIVMNQIVIEQMLAKLNVKPNIANNGFEALAAVEKADYDLIFMDCRMPEMDGFEATEKLRALGYQLPIIALTASTTADERQRCINCGMDDMLSKPYRGKQLRQIIEKWVLS